MKNSSFDIRSIYANDMTLEFVDSIVKNINPRSHFKFNIEQAKKHKDNQPE